MNINEIRNLFPITKTEEVYLNHAAISPYSTIHKSAMDSFYKERSRTNVEYFPTLLENSMQLKSRLGELINGNPNNISLIQNTTEGIMLLVDHIDWQDGDEIVIYRKDFPANVYPFLSIMQKKVKIVIVEDHDFVLDEDDYLDKITEKTRLVAISYVQFLTGQVADLKRISKRCKDVGAYLSVDSIQGLGAIPLDVIENDIDFLSNGGHKWMMFPMGLGYLYFSDRLKSEFNFHRDGWLNRENPFDLFNWENKRTTDGTRFEFGGYALLGAKIALEMMNFRYPIGESIISNRVIQLSRYCRSKLNGLGLNVHGDQERYSSGIVSFQHESDHLLDELKNHQVTIAAREGMYRVSPHFYNTEEDIDRFIDILNKVL